MSRSDKRARTRFRGVRLHDHEDDLLQAWADRLHTTVPELIRAVMFGEPLPCRPLCSGHHPSCSRQHHDMVESYRLTRYDQEVANEAALTGRGELAHFKAHGGRLATFGDWLRANTREEPPHGETAI